MNNVYYAHLTKDMDVKTVIGQTLETASAPYEVVVHCDDDEAGNTVSGTVTVPLVDTVCDIFLYDRIVSLIFSM
jgi:hypothetical protein